MCNTLTQDTLGTLLKFNKISFKKIQLMIYVYLTEKNVLENQMFAVYDQWSKGYFSLNAEIKIQDLNGVYYVH